jgi:hypothetical protein
MATSTPTSFSYPAYFQRFLSKISDEEFAAADNFFKNMRLDIENQLLDFNLGFNVKQIFDKLFGWIENAVDVFNVYSVESAPKWWERLLLRERCPRTHADNYFAAFFKLVVDICILSYGYYHCDDTNFFRTLVGRFSIEHAMFFSKSSKCLLALVSGQRFARIVHQVEDASKEKDVNVEKDHHSFVGSLKDVGKYFFGMGGSSDSKIRNAISSVRGSMGVIFDFHRIIKIIHDVFDGLKNWLFPPCQSEIDSRVTTFIDNVSRMSVHDKIESVPSDPEYARQIKELKEESIRLRDILGSSRNSVLNTAYRDAAMKVDKLHEYITTNIKCGTMSSRPIILWMYGSAGKGKTSAANCISRLWYGMMEKTNDIPVRDTKISYPKNFKDDYWDGYDGQHSVLLEDCFQVNDPSMLATVAATFIAIGQDSPYKLNMATLEGKAGTYFTSSLVIITANASPEQVANTLKVSDAQAFLRRISLEVKVTRPGTQVRWSDWKFQTIDREKKPRADLDMIGLMKEIKDIKESYSKTTQALRMDLPKPSEMGFVNQMEVENEADLGEIRIQEDDDDAATQYMNLHDSLDDLLPHTSIEQSIGDKRDLGATIDPNNDWVIRMPDNFPEKEYMRSESTLKYKLPPALSDCDPNEWCHCDGFTHLDYTHYGANIKNPLDHRFMQEWRDRIGPSTFMGHLCKLHMIQEGRVNVGTYVPPDFLRYTYRNFSPEAIYVIYNTEHVGLWRNEFFFCKTPLSLLLHALLPRFKLSDRSFSFYNCYLGFYLIKAGECQLDDLHSNEDVNLWLSEAYRVHALNDLSRSGSVFRMFKFTPTDWLSKLDMDQRRYYDIWQTQLIESIRETNDVITFEATGFKWIMKYHKEIKFLTATLVMILAFFVIYKLFKKNKKKEEKVVAPEEGIDVTPEELETLNKAVPDMKFSQMPDGGIKVEDLPEPKEGDEAVSIPRALWDKTIGKFVSQSYGGQPALRLQKLKVQQMASKLKKDIPANVKIQNQAGAGVEVSQQYNGVARNMVHFSIFKKGETKSAGRLHAMFLRRRILLLPTHTLMYAGPDHRDVQIFYPTRKENNLLVIENFFVFDKDVWVPRFECYLLNGDLMVINLEEITQIPLAKEMTNKFIPEANLAKVTNGLTSLTTFKYANSVLSTNTVQAPAKIKMDLVVPDDENTFGYTLRNYVSFKYATESGNCGCPYYTNDPHCAPGFLFAIHIAYDNVRCEAVGQILTKEMVQEILQAWPAVTPQAEEDVEIPHMDSQPPPVQTSDWEALYAQLDVREISDVSVHQPTKTMFRQTPWSGLLIQNNRIPVKQKPFINKKGIRIDPKLKAMWDYAIKQKDFTSEQWDIFATCGEVLSGELPPCQNIEPLTWGEVVNGRVSALGVTPKIDMKKSGTWRAYVEFGKATDKGEFFECVKHRTKKCKECSASGEPFMPDMFLQHDLNELEYVLEYKKINLPFITFFKDEVLDEAKVDEGKIRAFDGSPIELFLLMKRWFGSFREQITSDPVAFHMSTGINPHSTQWKTLHDDLDRFDQAFDGDYKKYDKHIMFEVAICAESVILGWYDRKARQLKNQSEKTMRYHKIRANLLNSVIIVLHHFRNIVFQTVGPNPSGQYMTDIWNNIINMLLHMYCYCKFVMQAQQIEFTNEIAMSFFRLNAINCGGDDHILTNNIPGYNFQFIKETMAEVGHVYTPADKSEYFLSDFKRLCEVTYLKRRFEVHNGLVFAPLEINVVLNIMNWKTNKIPDVQAFKDTARSVIIEMFHYGRYDYDRFCSILNEEFNKRFSSRIDFATYNEMMDKFIEGKIRFVNQGKDWAANMLRSHTEKRRQLNIRKFDHNTARAQAIALAERNAREKEERQKTEAAQAEMRALVAQDRQRELEEKRRAKREAEIALAAKRAKRDQFLDAKREKKTEKLKNRALARGQTPVLPRKEEEIKPLGMEENFVKEMPTLTKPPQPPKSVAPTRKEDKTPRILKEAPRRVAPAPVETNKVAVTAPKGNGNYPKVKNPFTKRMHFDDSVIQRVMHNQGIKNHTEEMEFAEMLHERYQAPMIFFSRSVLNEKAFHHSMLMAREISTMKGDKLVMNFVVQGKHFWSVLKVNGTDDYIGVGDCQKNCDRCAWYSYIINSGIKTYDISARFAQTRVNKRRFVNQADVADVSNDTTETVVIEDTQQTTSFANNAEKAVTTAAIDRHPLYHADPYNDQTPKQLLERPFILDRPVWATSNITFDILGYYIFPKDSFQVCTPNQCVLSNFKFITGDLELTLLFNTNISQYGLLLMEYYPGWMPDSVPGDLFNQLKDQPYSVNRCVLLDASSRNVCKLVIPNLTPFQFMDYDLGSDSLHNTSMGTVKISVLNPLNDATTSGSFSITGTLYARWMNVKTAGLIAQAEKDAEIVEAEKKAPSRIVSRVLEGTTSVLKSVSTIPYVGKYAASASVLTSVAASVTKMLGLSLSPEVTAPMAMVPKPIMGNTSHGIDLSENHGMAPDSFLSTDEELVFAAKTDYDLIHNYMLLPALVDVFSVAESTPIGTIFATYQLGPSLRYGATQSTPGSNLGRFCSQWRGGIKLHFIFVAPMFASARVRLIYAPAGVSLPADDVDIMRFKNVVVDIKGTTEYSLYVPYLSRYPSLYTVTSTFGRTLDVSEYSIGTIYCQLLNPIQNFSSGSTAAIGVSLFMSCGEDMIFSNLRELFWIPKTDPFVPGPDKKDKRGYLSKFLPTIKSKSTLNDQIDVPAPFYTHNADGSRAHPPQEMFIKSHFVNQVLANTDLVTMFTKTFPSMGPTTLTVPDKVNLADIVTRWTEIFSRSIKVYHDGIATSGTYYGLESMMLAGKFVWLFALFRVLRGSFRVKIIPHENTRIVAVDVRGLSETIPTEAHNLCGWTYGDTVTRQPLEFVVPYYRNLLYFNACTTYYKGAQAFDNWGFYVQSIDGTTPVIEILLSVGPDFRVGLPIVTPPVTIAP